MAESLVYLYGLVRSQRAPSLKGAPEGLPGTGPLRAIDGGGGVWLIVAAASAERYDSAAIERGLKDIDWVSQCAVAHERVIRYCARTRTTVPTRLFTLFRGDERAREHVRRSARRLARVFARVDGCEEWGVRMFVDAASAAPPPRKTPARPDAGRRFLEQKREQHRTATAQAAGAPRAAASLFRQVARAARAHRRIPVVNGGTSRMLIDGAFLVPRGGRREFRAAVGRAIEAAQKRGVRVSVNGPWPPYNFVGDKA
jgi:hypothetical protein